MKHMMIVAAAFVALATGNALAADHQIQMLNKGEKGAMVFQPDFICPSSGILGQLAA